jgi:hypothetical protein
MLLAPFSLIAGGMIFGVMDGAERHGEFIAHFESYASRLCVADGMGMRHRRSCYHRS